MTNIIKINLLTGQVIIPEHAICEWNKVKDFQLAQGDKGHFEETGRTKCPGRTLGCETYFPLPKEDRMLKAQNEKEE